MNISSYADFIDAAKSQLEPQRVLFVFAAAELPAQHTETQKQRFHEQQGGALAPVMCVDKTPAELDSFAALVEESGRTGQDWDIAFAAVLSGRHGIAPDAATAEKAMKKMIEAIHQGAISKFLAFNRAGELVQLT